VNASSDQGSFSIGEVLLGKYRVERVLGRGGMGVVLAATHLELKHRVAIKLLSAALPGSEQFETRFLREAQVAASLRSENVVRVFDVGRLENGTPYMVMEWLDGHDLEHGPKGRELPIEETVDYVIQACDAMTAAHAQGLIHRDLKPANLYLVSDEHGVPTIKVLDFGISKVRQDIAEQVSLTQTNGVMGSPLYMAPEQARSARDVDARADIWSLGTILYELITGVPPFGGETLASVLIAVTTQEPAPLRMYRPETPQGLESAVMACLRKDPAERIATTRELQQLLLPYGSMRSQAKMALRSSRPPLSSVPPVTQAPALSELAVSARSAPPAALTTGAGVESTFHPNTRAPARWRLPAVVLGMATLTGALGYGWRVLSVRRANDTAALSTTTTTPEPRGVAVASPTGALPAGSVSVILAEPSAPPAVPANPARPLTTARAALRPALVPSPTPVVSARATAPSTHAPPHPAPQPTRNPLSIDFK
jgi:serine/threonine-protein kinase